MNKKQSLDDYLQERVVCDTQGPLIYIGVLNQWDEVGYWLSEVEVHDRSDGHSTKELFLFDASSAHRRGEDRMNRKAIFIDRQTVASISRLEDVLGSSSPMDTDALP